jgi:hypothetical protein
MSNLSCKIHYKINKLLIEANRPPYNPDLDLSELLLRRLEKNVLSYILTKNKVVNSPQLCKCKHVCIDFGRNENKKQRKMKCLLMFPPFLRHSSQQIYNANQTYLLQI